MPSVSMVYELFLGKYVLNSSTYSCILKVTLLNILVWMQVYPDPVRVVAIGQKVEDLLSDPGNEKWLSISSELCGGKYNSI